MSIKISFKDLEDSNCQSVTDYCRLLVSENFVDLDQTLEVYRGDMLCLIVNNIKQAAELYPEGATFRKWRPRDRAEPRTFV